MRNIQFIFSYETYCTFLNLPIHAKQTTFMGTIHVKHSAVMGTIHVKHTVFMGTIHVKHAAFMLKFCIHGNHSC